MLLLTEPTRSGWLGAADRPQDRRRARRSRSDRRASFRCRAPRRSGSRPATTPAQRKRGADDGLLRAPFGTVRPLLRPSWFTAEPRDHGEDRVAARDARRKGA